MTSTLLIVQFVLAILLTIIILLQKSSSIGLGAYSGSNDSLFGAKGPANFLTKATMALGLVFVINTLVLGYLYNEQRNQSAVDKIQTDSLIPLTPITQTPVAPTAPEQPLVPTVPENK
ncbi:preprotein translocase subunit SecG [Arcobacter aquimarinus]|uniref:Protein-export membrane protein SecG n=1 Tax=Arcobacter aquimarinus TaxID=1315211 RepID=A0AAE7E1J4_9BACT|nr:preprotein translocase subunit SecG [Arcobacter aquimarinus]QKE27158.1 preprotein translocase SecYEG, SecG subunit [Arcobacter aquimarinus]RXI35168.1 preprotein translocase subunit SecG [Arcobacter aquimarinus]